jgi:hypothetical protein
MKRTTEAIALFLGILAPLSSTAQAQGLRAVGPLRGYSCMSLNLTEEQYQQASAKPPIRQQPSASAVQVGTASALVIVSDQIRTQNGYVAVMTLNGHPGWLEANKIRPYHNVTNPNTRCVVSMMSNGQPGFAFQH